MNQLIIAIFSNEAQAYEVAGVLESSGDPVSRAVRGVAVIVRHPDGKVSEQKWASRLAFRAPIGALVGALIGAPVGLIGSAIGFAAGGFIGFTRDLANLGVEESFFDEVAAQLTPGKSALVIEVPEDATAPLEARLRELGATVMHTDLKSEDKPSPAT